MSLLSILAGDANLKYINTKKDLVERINEAEKVWEKTSQIDLQKKSQELSGKIIAEGYSDDIIVDAFALAREAAKRTLNQRQFDVQILGGLALHEGKIVEMKTGEGKTLVATTAAYLNALEKKGVHIVTVNDYLAKRDMVWMGQIYYYLGVSVSCITQSGSFLYDPNYKMEQPEAQVTLDEKRDELASFKVFQEFLRPISRKEAYQADITYGTNSEFGFDYLRDNLVWDLNDRAQRGHHFVIIDEVDSILIDEARTPLIISVPDEDAGKMYSEFTRIVPRLEKDQDYTVDEKLKAISLTEEGLNKIESIFGINIFDEKGITAVHHLEEALKAHVLFLKDRDYIVKNDEILIVDEFTGRILEGRRYSGGLHQAIEAKEGVTIKQESRTAATITLQNYFRMYQKISGMTGTAATSAEEFHKVYGVDVVMIPTNKPMRRNDSPDQIYKTTEGKYRQIVQEVKRRHESGQPVLIGTVSIERNEYLGALLKREGIPFQILNAKNHEEEGAIIAQAGRKGSVTVATNMAGRGVDIILGGNPPDEIEKEKVIANGGLFVLGTERHEARRIDNQLRGRSGRQGDPGASQFFVSLEDDLMRVFGSKNIGGMMSKLGLTEDMAIQHPLISKGLETAQSKIEGYNFDLRKHILEYDDVFNKQRTAFYNRRMELLRLTEEKKLPEKILPELSEKLISLSEFWLNTDQDTFYHNLSNILPGLTKEEADELFVEDPDIRSKQIKEMFEKRYEVWHKSLDEKTINEVLKSLTLRIIDTMWMDHLEEMEYLRDSVNLRAYGQKDPLVEYKQESYRLYKNLEENYLVSLLNILFKVEVKQNNVENVSKKKEIDPYSHQNVGRNDLCPCGSGKKYKRCHGA